VLRPEQYTNFLGCYYHRCKCQTFRDVRTFSGVTLAERYEQTLSRIEQIKRAGYRFKIHFECKFDEAEIVEQKPELLTHPIVKQVPRSLEMLCMGVELKPCGSTIRYGRKRNRSSIMTL